MAFPNFNLFSIYPAIIAVILLVGRYPKFKTRCVHDIMGMKGEIYAQGTPVN